MGANQNVRLIAINGSGGAFTLVRASMTCRRVEIIEDFSGNGGVGQGLEYNLIDASSGADGQQTLEPPAPAFASIAPQTEPLILGNPSYQAKSFGPVLGSGPMSPGAGIPPILGTPLIQIRAAGADATVIRVTEFA